MSCAERSGLQQSGRKNPVPKVFWQHAFPGLCGDGGRQVSVHCRAGILCFDSPPCLGWMGRAAAPCLVWSPGSFGTIWLSPQAGAFWGQEPWCSALTSLIRGPLLKFVIYSKGLMAVLMSDVLSVFTMAENLLSKSKYCAKSESQSVL